MGHGAISAASSSREAVVPDSGVVAVSLVEDDDDFTPISLSGDDVRSSSQEATLPDKGIALEYEHSSIERNPATRSSSAASAAGPRHISSEGSWESALALMLLYEKIRGRPAGAVNCFHSPAKPSLRLTDSARCHRSDLRPAFAWVSQNQHYRARPS